MNRRLIVVTVLAVLVMLVIFQLALMAADGRLPLP